jgi:hypothetical protein
MDDAFLARHPVDADIQKTAHDTSKRKKGRRPKRKRDLSKNLWIEDGH